MTDTRPQIDLNLPGYEILEELGRGGVSTVYLARHRLLDREVAIKVMSPVLAVEEGFNKRFLREGQTIAQFKHPGIVTVYDVAVVNHRPFIAMEYLPGGSLKDRMSDPVPPDQAVALLRSIADSLGYAHGRGVFHRDVKPENILFKENGTPVLTDFGIAKSDSQETALTSVGVVVGTPRYISPEQAQGHDSDARSDIYALGVILFEMLTGRPPYDVKGSMSLLYAHINEPIPRLPSDLDEYQELVDDLLAKEPEQRVSDCESLVERLDQIDKPQYPRLGPVTKTRDAVAGDSGRQPRNVRPALAVAGLVVAVVALLLWSQGYGPRSMPFQQSEQDFRNMVSRLLAEGNERAAPAESPFPMPHAGEISLQDGGQEPEGVGSAGGNASAESKFVRAQARFYGRGTQRDVPAAVELYKQAASDGHVLSQYYLGVAYGNGDGVARDEAQAVEWLASAADGGSEGAKYNMILARIFGTQRDTRLAAELALELAEQKYAPVYRILGWMYNTGTGVDSSFSQSVRWNVKTMVGDVTGKAGPPRRVVHHWERRLEQELNEIRDSTPTQAKPLLR